MRIGEVIGTVTLSQSHPSFVGATFKMVVPLSHEALLEDGAGTEKTARKPGAEFLVVYDELGAGIGSRIAIAEGPEAAAPFRPAIKPCGAYNAAILDRVELER